MHIEHKSKLTRRPRRYFSPYPLVENEVDDGKDKEESGGPSSRAYTKIPGVHRATARSHGRTSDLLAGGLGRTHVVGERSMLWVCEMCFKYMTDGLSWELHKVSLNYFGEEKVLRG